MTQDEAKRLAAGDTIVDPNGRRWTVVANNSPPKAVFPHVLATLNDADRVIGATHVRATFSYDQLKPFLRT